MNIKSLKVTVATAGTRVPLSATTLIARSLIIKSIAANSTNLLGVGGSDVAAANWYELSSGHSVEIKAGSKNGTDEGIDLSKIYLDSSSNGLVASVLYTV